MQARTQGSRNARKGTALLGTVKHFPRLSFACAPAGVRPAVHAATAAPAERACAAALPSTLRAAAKRPPAMAAKGALDGNVIAAIDAKDEAVRGCAARAQRRAIAGELTARACLLACPRVPQHLAALGYKQELKREITFMGSVGITLGCMQARAACTCARRGGKRAPRANPPLTSDAPRLRAAVPASPQPLLCAGVFYVRSSLLRHLLMLRCMPPPRRGARFARLPDAARFLTSSVWGSADLSP